MLGGGGGRAFRGRVQGGDRGLHLASALGGGLTLALLVVVHGVQLLHELRGLEWANADRVAYYGIRGVTCGEYGV